MTTYGEVACRRDGPPWVGRNGLSRRPLSACYLLFSFVYLLIISSRTISADSVYSAYNVSQQAHAEVDGTVSNNILNIIYLKAVYLFLGSMSPARTLVAEVILIGVNHPTIVRETPHFDLFPAFPHFCQNVPHFWLYF